MRDSLARFRLKPALTKGQLLALAARAWHDDGIALFRPEDLTNEWDRQAVVNAADRQYGRRTDG